MVCFSFAAEVNQQDMKTATVQVLPRNEIAGLEKVDMEKVNQALRRFNRKLMIHIGRQIKVIDFNSVAYFYSESKITFAVMLCGKRHVIEPSLNQIENMANPLQFFRINRRFIVNIESIHEMFVYPKSRIRLELRPETEVETIVSRIRTPDFKKWLVGE